MEFYEKKSKVKKELTSGSHLIRKQAIGDGDIKMQCSNCGRFYWVDLNIAIVEIARRGACNCSSCGDLSLKPY